MIFKSFNQLRDVMWSNIYHILLLGRYLFAILLLLIKLSNLYIFAALLFS